MLDGKQRALAPSIVGTNSISDAVMNGEIDRQADGNRHGDRFENIQVPAEKDERADGRQERRGDRHDGVQTNNDIERRDKKHDEGETDGKTHGDERAKIETSLQIVEGEVAVGGEPAVTQFGRRRLGYRVEPRLDAIPVAIHVDVDVRIVERRTNCDFDRFEIALVVEIEKIVRIRQSCEGAELRCYRPVSQTIRERIGVRRQSPDGAASTTHFVDVRRLDGDVLVTRFRRIQKSEEFGDRAYETVGARRQRVLVDKRLIFEFVAKTLKPNLPRWRDQTQRRLSEREVKVRIRIIVEWNHVIALIFGFHAENESEIHAVGGIRRILETVEGKVRFHVELVTRQYIGRFKQLPIATRRQLKSRSNEDGHRHADGECRQYDEKRPFELRDECRYPLLKGNR